MSEITNEINSKTAVRMTAQKGASCKWCRNPLPENAAHNPTWPWKQVQGRGTVAFCGPNCMDWYNYKYRVNKLIGVMRLKHFSDTEIDDRVAKLSKPTCPMPEVVGGLNNEFTTLVRKEDEVLQTYASTKYQTVQVDSRKYLEEANKMNEVPVMPAEAAPAVDEEEPVQAVETPAEPAEKPVEAVNEKAQRLHHIARQENIDGEYSQTIILRDENNVPTVSATFAGVLTRDMISEMYELAGYLEEVLPE